MKRVYAVQQATGHRDVNKFVVTSNKLSAAGYPLARGGRTSLPMSYEDATKIAAELNQLMGA